MPTTLTKSQLDSLLSKSFTVREFVASATADRLGLDNTPTQEEINNAKRLCENVLQPIRDHFGLHVKVTSGIRMLPLNRALRSKDTSDHVDGNAADIEILHPSVSNFQLADFIRSSIPRYKQLILECYTPGDPNSGWVHVSYDPMDNRKENLTFDGSHYSVGLVQ